MNKIIGLRFIIILSLIASAISDNICQTINWDTETIVEGLITNDLKPCDYQLYPRNAEDYALVKVSGECENPGLTEGITLKVIKTDFYGNETVIYYLTNWFNSNNYKFDFSVNIHSELSDYKFEYKWSTPNVNTQWELIAEKVVCGDAFLIAGQSNASAVLGIQGEDEEYNNLYGGTGMDPYGRYSRSYGRMHPGYVACGEMLSEWGQSNVLRDDDWQTPDCYDFHVGAWGLYLQYRIQKVYGIPTCIINGARGGTSLISNLPQADNFDLNSYFGNYNYRVHQAGLNGNIKGVLWYQGENEAGLGLGYKEFQDLYTGWMTNYSNPFPKVYVIQLSPPPSPTNYGNIMEELRRLASIFPDLEVMATNGVGNRNGIHFHPEGYSSIGERLFKLLERDWYCNINNIEYITPPQVQRVYYEDNRCVVEFDQTLEGELSDDLYNVWRCMHLNVRLSSLAPDPNPKIEGNKFTFVVPNYNATKISYLDYIPDYNYEGYLRNTNNVGAFAFYNIPITTKESLPNLNSLTYGENYSRNGPIINHEYASGRLSGLIENDLETFDIFNQLGQLTQVPVNAHVNLKSAHTIFFNPGFKALKNSYLKVEAGIDLFAFTPNNYCSSKSKNLSPEKNTFDEFSGLKFENNINKTTNIIVYPNPSNGKFKIKMLERIDSDVNILIYNMNGLLINQKHLSVNCMSIGCSIDISGTKKGVYLLRIKTIDNLVHKQIVIL